MSETMTNCLIGAARSNNNTIFNTNSPATSLADQVELSETLGLKVITSVSQSLSTNLLVMLVT